MNIMILEDSKGFTKMVHVPEFSPQYVMPLKPEPSRAIGNPGEELQAVRQILFIPMGTPVESHGHQMMVYKQQDF